MSAIRLGLVLGALAVALSAQQASARFRPAWPYDKLFQEADVVMLATAEATESTKDSFDGNIWPLEIVGQETSFKVTQALKGDAGKRPVKVLHFKFGGPKKGVKDEPVVRNGPRFVVFRTKDVTVHRGGGRITLPRPEYLLFLKRRADGRYEPVSGQTDPDLSVREVGPPQDGPSDEK